MMKQFLYIFLMMIFSAFTVKAQDKALILEVLEKQRSDWNSGNLKGYMQGYWQSDSLVFVGKNGPNYGWQNTLNNYQKSYPDKAAMGFLYFDIKEVRLLGNDYAFVLGGWRLKRKNDEPKGFFTLMMRKIKGEWKVIADHSS